MSRADDLDDPFINQYADKVTDPEEVLMRADFARAEELRRTSVYAETEEQRVLLLSQARGVDARWHGRADDLGEAWCYLDFALHDWKCEPDYMRRFYDQFRHDQDQGVDAISDMEWRSQLQAREMTGHGSWEQAAESASESALADYQPGHALADAVARNGSQRDGAER
ncbi:hypothetical protein AB0J47_02625 [Nocardia sp. NPDC049737]|uniref:hypothetical protein n=1 Tax=Nocardia sp. NPDC049737 TaxID=3154358 RepID=UPI003420CCB1